MLNQQHFSEPLSDMIPNTKRLNTDKRNYRETDNSNYKTL